MPIWKAVIAHTHTEEALTAADTSSPEAVAYILGEEEEKEYGDVISMSLPPFLSLSSSLRGCVGNVMVLSASRAARGRSFYSPPLRSLALVPRRSRSLRSSLCVVELSFS